jgi:uncharacterized membrane protein YoaK (UPF0700 family)
VCTMRKFGDGTDDEAHYVRMSHDHVATIVALFISVANKRNVTDGRRAAHQSTVCTGSIRAILIQIKRLLLFA